MNNETQMVMWLTSECDSDNEEEWFMKGLARLLVQGCDLRQWCRQALLYSISGIVPLSFPYPSSPDHNLYCTSATSQTVSHKARLVGLCVHEMNRRSAAARNKKKAAGGGEKGAKTEIFCCSQTGHAVSWSLRERRKGWRETGRYANWTGWLIPTSATLPEEVWSVCVTSTE